ncbi:MAG: hypothetical protein ABF876_13145 [Acetobacter aceti]|nr:hypothetical protein [Acetobacter aceti]
MIRTILRKLTIITAGISAVVMVANVKSAHAERIISDYEASKLTLESLTAVPVYHPIVHHVSARHAAVASRSRTVLASRAQSAHPMVHLVSFHVVKKASHAAHMRNRT